ncbi:alpha-glucuronidase family glycosyl hydrolase, partial [Hymenobacter agri]
MRTRLLLLVLLLVAAAPLCRADDGYRLWLKYDLVADAGRRGQYQAATHFIAADGKDAVLQTAATELQRGLQGLLGQPVPLLAKAPAGGTKRGIQLEIIPTTTNDGNAQTARESYRVFTRGSQLVVAGG